MNNPTCPECDGPMWDQRKSKWWGNGLSAAGRPKPVFKCKDKECDGVIWPDDENYDFESDPIPQRTARAPVAPAPAQTSPQLLGLLERVAVALEVISARLAELKWTAPLSKKKVEQYESEAQGELGGDERTPF